MHRLYSLCNRVNALEAVKAAYKEYIKSAGLKIVKDEEKVTAMRFINLNPTTGLRTRCEQKLIEVTPL